MSLRNEGTMEVNVSVCTDGPIQRVSVDISPGSDMGLTNERSFSWVSSAHKGNESGTTSGVNLLPSVSNKLDDGPPRPRPRYKRRNSAVASMLLPVVRTSMNHATNLRSPCARSGSPESLHLSTAASYPILDLSEAIKKAQELLQENSESPPPLENVRAKKHMFKRASVPWGQTYPELTTVQSDNVVERSHKRQRRG